MERDQDPHAGVLRLRKRLDLEVYPQRARSRRVWIIKDPITLRFFQFREEEFAILCGLDGRSTLEEIKAGFENRFAPRRITLTRLHSFVAGLHRKGLVISETQGQGNQLHERLRQQRRNERIAAIANPLAIRFRGLDPDRLLDRLYSKTGWVFSPGFLFCCVAIVLAALYVVLGNLDEFRSRLPELQSFLSPQNLVLMAIAMAGTKLLHEFGHALTCKHFGGECHEMGIMLLVFTPCLYCNVTDAWKLPSRWQRVAIGAAGIAVETLLAAVCVLLWWTSQPGLFNSICLNVVVVCSLGTLLLNGNPLLRYDGYYILSDALEMPNLWQDSRQSVRRLLMRTLIGIDLGAAISSQGRQTSLLAYGMASMLYRVIVIASILYLVYQICKPLGLIVVAELLTVVLLGGVLVGPLTSLAQLASNPVIRRKIQPVRAALSFGTVTALLIAAFWVPLPCGVGAPVVIEPGGARQIYVSVPGRMTRSVAAGDAVDQGQTLCVLSNDEITRELESVQGKIARQIRRLQSLESMRGRSREIATQIPTAREILSDLQARARQLRVDTSALTLTAPIAGTVLPPPRVPADRADELELVRWSGTPIEEPNRGAYLERKTLLCLIGDPDSFEAAVFIDQSEVPFVHPGQRVRMLLECSGGRAIDGTIQDISQVNLQNVPEALAIDQSVTHEVNRDGTRRPKETLYKARVRIDAADSALQIGVRGRAKIAVQWQPLSQRIRRFLSRTFKPVI